MDTKSTKIGIVLEMETTLRRQQELVTQLRALILPLLPQDGLVDDLAAHLFEDVIACNTSAMSNLQAGNIVFTTGHYSGGAQQLEIEDDKSMVIMKNCTATADDDMVQKQQAKQPNISAGQKRRRINDEKRSRSLVTHAPHYDGHQWRKYGQKVINGRQHPRSYYRCTFRERNCSATKTIQQQDQNNCRSTDDEDAEYTVVYYGHHTCKGDATIGMLPQLVSVDDLQVNSENVGTPTEIQEKIDAELDVPALLEVFDNYMLNWEWEDCIPAAS